MCGLSMAFTMRRVICAGIHLELRMHAGDDDVEAGEQGGVLIEASVLEDVHLDAGEDAERRHGGVDRLHHLELADQTLGIEAVGDGEARAVVGERPVVVPEGGGGLSHLGDGAPTVGPVRVAVAVALQQVRAERRRRGDSAGARTGPRAACRYEGVSPASASAMTRAVVSPTPGRSVSRLAAARCGEGVGVHLVDGGRGARGTPGPCRTRPAWPPAGRRSVAAPRIRHPQRGGYVTCQHRHMPSGTPAVAIEVDGRTLNISNPDKVFFSTRGETKLDLVRYYFAVGTRCAAGCLRAPHGAQALPQRCRGRILLPEARAARGAAVDRDGHGHLPERASRR